jgi:hypothetical protein
MPVAVEDEKPENSGVERSLRGPRCFRFSGRGQVCIQTSRLFWCQGASMSTLRYSLRNLFQRKSIGQYGHIQDLQGVPFYEARQPWWARFTWGFIAADLLVT